LFRRQRRRRAGRGGRALTRPAARAQGEGLLELTRFSYMSNLAGARRAAAAAQASAALPADDGAAQSC
jgi:hypothetical protein